MHSVMQSLLDSFATIIAYDPQAALKQAKQLDDERRQGKVRSPMHGIPVLVKDNTSTVDLPTTGGSTALANHSPPRDAHLVKRLRDAGCIILAKTNLSQWSNFRSTQSISGWSSVGGQCKNPYSTDRNTSGSSSGSGAATAANLGAVSIGTETNGSIVSPANNNCLVGFKPTVGLVSRSGIIPISSTQDGAGPMTRTVEDAAYLLTAIAGTDSEDSATAEADQHKTDYTQHLKTDGLKGKRIGVVTNLWTPRDNVSQLFAASVELMRSAGAIIVDDLKLCDTTNNAAPGATASAAYGQHQMTLMLYEMKHGLNDWLKNYAPNHPTIRTLEDLIKYNEQNAAIELPTFKQEFFLRAQGKGELTDADYQTAVMECKRICTTEGIDKLMDEHKLDGLIAPTASPASTIDHFCGDFYGGGSAASIPAVAGYPHITVPQGFVNGVLPCGISFIGQKWHEPQLIEVAYAYEQLSKYRKPPQFLRNVKLHV